MMNKHLIISLFFTQLFSFFINTKCYNVHVTITGATGVLGSALSRRLIQRWNTNATDQKVPKLEKERGDFQHSQLLLHLMHKNRTKIIDTLRECHRFSSGDSVKLMDTCYHFGVHSADHKYNDLFLDESKSLLENLPTQHSCQHILVNCAGVRYVGQTREIMRDSFHSNVKSAVDLAQRFLENHKNAKTNKPNEESPLLSIINISSGDGESLCINSEVNRHLQENVHTITDLNQYIDELIALFDPTFEYAFGPSPMYSLSKRLLNKATELLHKEYACVGNRIKVVASCPGDILSPMTTIEERASLVDVNSAADHIIDLMEIQDNKNKESNNNVESGHFYRFGRKIPW